MAPCRTPRAAAALGFAAGVSVAATAGLLVWPAAEPDVARYREVRDWTRGAFVRGVTEDELLDHALRGLASGLDDYSEWYDREALSLLDRQNVGRYQGLGISIRHPLSEGRILFPLEGSPAEAAGIRPGDRIERVQGKEYAQLGHDAFRALISTPEPADVDLEVVGLDGKSRRVQVRTSSVLEPTVRHERIVDVERGIGYVAIHAFSQQTAVEFDAALKRLGDQGLQGLVIDLRGNSGGVLVAAVQVASRFIGDGVLVRTQGRTERYVHEAPKGSARWANLPLAVLVDPGSASASEVLAGALQDHRAAVLVGEATFGKGAVQTIHRLPERTGAIKVTTSRYETPAGQRLDRGAEGAHGLVPDLWVHIDADARQAIHAYLSRSSPPERWTAAIRDWERAEGLDLLPSHPPDPQLDAALRLFAGARPGASELRGDA